MDDAAYVSELLAILTNPTPTGIDPADPYGQADDGIDRYDGFGRDVRVTSARLVPGEHAQMLEVSFVLDLPEAPELDGVPTQGSFLLPVDAEWRRLSGYADPAAYAPVVARRVLMQVHRHVRAHRPEDAYLLSVDDLPHREAQWSRLLEHLGHEGTVVNVAPGRIEVRDVRGTISTLTVLVTAEEWEHVLRRTGTGAGLGDYFTDLLGPRQQDEHFLVFWEGDLVRSTRAELPPVRGTAAQRRMEAIVAAARAENPDATFGWYAERPGNQPDDR